MFASVCFIRQRLSSDTSVARTELSSVLSPRVRKARLAQLDEMDFRVLWVCPAQLDPPEYLGRMEIRCISQQHLLHPTVQLTANFSAVFFSAG